MHPICLLDLFPRVLDTSSSPQLATVFLLAAFLFFSVEVPSVPLVLGLISFDDLFFV